MTLLGKTSFKNVNGCYKPSLAALSWHWHSCNLSEFLFQMLEVFQCLFPWKWEGLVGRSEGWNIHLLITFFFLPSHSFCGNGNKCHSTPSIGEQSFTCKPLCMDLIRHRESSSFGLSFTCVANPNIKYTSPLICSAYKSDSVNSRNPVWYYFFFQNEISPLLILIVRYTRHTHTHTHMLNVFLFLLRFPPPRWKNWISI